MSLLESIKLKNFRSFRDETEIILAQLSYLVGINNAGKTNILQGIKCFFDDAYVTDSSFLNRTELTGKKGGYNKSEISILFNLESLTTGRKSTLIKKYSEKLWIKKAITYYPKTKVVNIIWNIAGEDYSNDQLPDDIFWLKEKVKITYIHPQEGKQLLNNVQARLRQRLLANWGRSASLTHSINELENNWAEMRKVANKSLSTSLTDSLQKFWPDCNITINLPRNIKDIIDIADINFQGYSTLPEISLTDQGTGAQSTVLYIAHFLLDSDRSLNRGEYHPIWLMEEPESFLHADLLLKLSSQIHSDPWINNIQMITSTHSPILLASSRTAKTSTIWNVLENNKVVNVIDPNKTSMEQIEKIGKIMGDVNFSMYFTLSQKEVIVFIEDTLDQIKKAYQNSGITITNGPKNISEIGHYLNTITSSPEIIPRNSKIYFIVDNDKGKSQIQRFLDTAKSTKEKNGITLYQIITEPSVNIILLPKNTAVEDLFLEYDNHLKDCVYKIYNKDFTLKPSIPSTLSRAVDKARRSIVSNEQSVMDLIRNSQDVKDSFWEKVKNNNFSFAEEYKKALLSFIK